MKRFTGLMNKITGFMSMLLVVTLSFCGSALSARYIFSAEPEFTFLGDGRVKVTWESSEPMPPGRVVYGTVQSDDPFRIPRFRFSSREKGDELRTDHEVVIEPRRLCYPLADAASHRLAGGGVVVIRLELYRPGSRKLYLRYHRFAYRFDPPDQGEIICRPLPCVVTGPWIDRVGPGGAWISWDLDLPTGVELSWRSTDGEGDHPWFSRTLPAATRFEEELTGLRPDSDHEYRIRLLHGYDGGPVGRSWKFRTAPEPGQWPAGGVVRVAFLSDSRGARAGLEQGVCGVNRKVLRDLLVQAELAGADLICFGGDLIDGYTDNPAHYRQQLGSWLEAAECVGARIPIYEGMGNHEMLADDFSGGKGLTRAYRDKAGPENSESVFAEAFVNPLNGPPCKPGEPTMLENVYSFDRGPVHIVVLNNDYFVSSHPDSFGGLREGWLPDSQLDWLKTDLAAARERGQREIFLFAHEPAFPNGGHSWDGMYWGGVIPEVLDMRQRFWDILMDYRVRVVGFGDEHNYSRLRIDSRLGDQYREPVWQLVSGGAGAPYYAQEKDLPWSHLVSSFSVLQHFCLLEFRAEGVILEVYDSWGRLIEQTELY
jgi:hypothetical protein